MYRTIIKRDGFNPLTGSARYRVHACYEMKKPELFLKIRRAGGGGMWGFITNRYYQPNSFTTPRKVAGI